MSMFISAIVLAAGLILTFYIAPQQVKFCGGLFGCQKTDEYYVYILIGIGLIISGVSGIIGSFIKKTETHKQNVINNNNNSSPRALPIEFSKNTMEIQDVKQWQKEFSRFSEGVKSIEPNTKALMFLDHPASENSDIIFVLYKEAERFFVEITQINGNNVLKSKHSSLIATSERLIFVEPNEPSVFDCFYEDIVSIQPKELLGTIFFAIQTKAKVEIVIYFSISRGNVSRGEFAQFKSLLNSFFTAILPKNLKSVGIPSINKKDIVQASENNLRNDLLEAELAIASGDKKAAGLLIDKVLKHDFVNPTAWQLLYQLLGNGKDFSTFQKEFTSKYYPDKFDLLSK